MTKHHRRVGEHESQPKRATRSEGALFVKRPAYSYRPELDMGPKRQKRKEK